MRLADKLSDQDDSNKIFDLGAICQLFWSKHQNSNYSHTDTKVYKSQAFCNTFY